jgi:hypothetical protein
VLLYNLKNRMDIDNANQLMSSEDETTTKSILTRKKKTFYGRLKDVAKQLHIKGYATVEKNSI